MEEALEIMHRLFDGERVSGGRYFKTKDAVLHTRAERRPPFYVSAFGERAAGVAGAAWRRAVDAGRPRGGAADHRGLPRRVLGRRPRSPARSCCTPASRGRETDEEAFEGSKVWKAAFPDEFYVDDWHSPVEMQEHAQENVSDDEFREGFLIGSDTGEMTDRVREIEKLGATIVVLMNISGADPHGAIRTYGDRGPAGAEGR